MIREIHETLSLVMKDRSLDWRSCFTDVRAEPPGGRRVIVECSDRGVLEETQRRLSAIILSEEPELRFAVLPGPGLTREDVVVASNSVVDVRRSPSHAAELVTQVIYGDPVGPLKAEGDWVLVRLDDSYIGWVRSWHLKSLSRDEHDAFESGAKHRVGSNIVQIYEAPEESSLPLTDAVVGTPVAVGPSVRKGWRRVTLPDGKTGFTRSKDLARRSVPRRFSRDSLEKVGLRFLGIPYTWGGTTPKGFDCSGLVQRILRLHGILIPRDSDQQSLVGLPKAVGRIDDLLTGDLLFFGKSDQMIHHVAMYLREGLFIHARGQVRVNALVGSHPLFDDALVSEWRSTRDVVTK